ncbi:MAG: SAM-dependent methyltransferase [Myxococcales bacterium]|nr:SAM-dependent methyltransferase [Myxococcales bacterium]MCB9582578.1 SAM-dependent methyltransferase [Polyangiaceae bacterium]
MSRIQGGSRSLTSDWVAALRALYSEAPHDLAIIDDPAAVRLLSPALRWTVRGAAAVPFGVRALHRVLGTASFGLSYGVPLRTAAIDEAVRRSVDAGTRQVMVLGAGLDARAWRMPELAECVVFELDHPSTQAYKRERVAELDPLCREVRHCAIDFEHQTLGGVLGDAGFDASRPSMWIWEGVTMYLTPEAVDATLTAIAELSAPGSRLAVTYLPHDYAVPWLQRAGEIGARVIGEHLRARHEPAKLRGRLEDHGFELESDTWAGEWATGRWSEQERARLRVWERLAVARRL